ncbi:hypothetical protein ACOSP7_018884 [Xanthoceras sorbifolium]
MSGGAAVVGKESMRDVVSSHQHAKVVSWSVIWQLAFQSMGVVYGDLGTSPFYVLSGTFADGVKHVDDILGVLSLIFYAITLIPLINYVFIVLRANDNGDGGTFALYSFICPYAKVGLVPSEQAEDCDVSTYPIELPSDSSGAWRASKLKSKLENSQFANVLLLFVTLLGTSMVIGDGILTPSISVLSAVGGIKEATSAMTEDKIVRISVAVLVCLFTFQKLGTEKVGYTFAPIICIWFVLIGGTGVYNVAKVEPIVIKAVNPWYIFEYFRRNKKDAWISLGGVVLSITGSEALFATVGHFTVRSVQISTCRVVYPAIILCYFGEASALYQNTEYVKDAFYKSIPGPMYWPMFVVAVLAAVIASQAMISGSFSIIQQSLSLGCFPRVKVMHTSAKYEGQVYIPEINYLLMLACVGFTLGFKTTEKIGNAYGIAVVFVMTLTSFLLVFVMIIIWKSNMLVIISYVLIIGSVKLAYLISSVLYKFDQEGYLPLAFAAILMTVMFVWNNVYRKKYYYELECKISPEKLKEIALDRNAYRIPGLAMFYLELVQGIPPIFKHYADNISALHSVLVFVPLEERFIFRRVEPKELNVFRCIARYGYTDVQNKEKEHFELMLIEKLKEFIIEVYRFYQTTTDTRKITEVEGSEDLAGQEKDKSQEEENGEDAMAREIERVDRAWQDGVVHLLGENEVVAAEEAGMSKRLMIDYAYNYVKKNLRQHDKVFDHIPHKNMLKVGMTHEP